LVVSAPDDDLYACAATVASQTKPPPGEGVINSVTCTACAAIATVAVQERRNSGKGSEEAKGSFC